MIRLVAAFGLVAILSFVLGWFLGWHGGWDASEQAQIDDEERRADLDEARMREAGL